MIQVNINNTDTADDFVTLIDNNQNPAATIINNQRLNQGTSVSVNIQEDGDGKGNVTWTAIRANDSTITKTDSAMLTNLDTVNVSAS